MGNQIKSFSISKGFLELLSPTPEKKHSLNIREFMMDNLYNSGISFVLSCIVSCAKRLVYFKIRSHVGSGVACTLVVAG